jgi:hypothetical protein
MMNKKESKLAAANNMKFYSIALITSAV